MAEQRGLSTPLAAQANSQRSTSEQADFLVKF
jgi:hypothetical protein